MGYKAWDRLDQGLLPCFRPLLFILHPFKNGDDAQMNGYIKLQGEGVILSDEPRKSHCQDIEVFCFALISSVIPYHEGDGDFSFCENSEIS